MSKININKIKVSLSNICCNIFYNLLSKIEDLTDLLLKYFTFLDVQFPFKISKPHNKNTFN